MDAALQTIMRTDGLRDTFEERREEFVENSVIAVQIANGTFVPVLNTSSNKRRRLVVTTVRDNQTNVKIELFRGSDESMDDPEYVGSLIIDNIEPTESGGPDISVLLGVDDSGNLNATATDTRSGEYQSLSVGLDQLEQEGGYDMPDFQLNDEEDFDLASPSELDELTLDEPEELSLDDEDDFDLSSLDTETETETDTRAESAASESLGAGSAELTPAPEYETTPEPEASDDIFSFDDELSLDEPDELTLEEPEAEEPATEESELEELSLDDEEDEDDFDLSALDLDTEPETESEPAAEPTPESDSSDDIFSLDEEPLSELGADDELDDLDDLTLDEPEELTADEQAEEQADEHVEAEPLASDDTFSFDEEPSSELGDDDDLDDLDDLSFDNLDSEDETGGLSLDELSTPNAEETAALTDVSEEDFSFDESLSFETEGGSEAEDDEFGDLDLGALTEEEGGLSFETDEPSADTGFDEGLVEADLGDEDFTFDEGVEDEPLFVDPEPLEEDTLSPEEFDHLDSQPLPAAEEQPLAEEPMQPRRSNAIIFVGYMILALAALGVVTYLVFRLMEGPPAPPLRAGLIGRFSSAWAFLGIPVAGRHQKR